MRPDFRKVFNSSRNSEVELKMKCISCSYCGEKMNFSAVQVKRPVPQGAQDLGIFDETYCWCCPKCNQMSSDYLTQCNLCNDVMFNETALLYIASKPADSFGLYGYFSEEMYDGNKHIDPFCHRHLRCEMCHKNIDSHKFLETYYDTRLSDGCSVYYNYFFHHECYAELERIKKEETIQYRIKIGHCVNCNGSLSFFDKISGRQAHKSCPK